MIRQLAAARCRVPGEGAAAGRPINGCNLVITCSACNTLSLALASRASGALHKNCLLNKTPHSSFLSPTMPRRRPARTLNLTPISDDDSDYAAADLTGSGALPAALGLGQPPAARGERCVALYVLAVHC